MENKGQISVDELITIIGRKEVEKQFLIAENQRLRQELNKIKGDKGGKNLDTK